MRYASNRKGEDKTTKKKIFYLVLITFIGYILSPLSWWNDLFVNIPLAYAFAFPFTLINPNFYLPAFLLGYWLTNLVGFLLFHFGMSGFIKKGKAKASIHQQIVVTLCYTLIIVILVWLNWLPSPTELTEKFI